MSKAKYCPFCAAGITVPLSKAPKDCIEITIGSRYNHPGFPMSRLLAITSFPCSRCSVTVAAWNPHFPYRAVEDPNELAFAVLHQSERADGSARRLSASVTYAQVREAGLELRRSSRGRGFDFVEIED